MRYREALNTALREEMHRDESVMLLGEDIGVFNGAFKVAARRGHQLEPTHSLCLEVLFLQVPGLLLAIHITALDVKGLDKVGNRHDNPVIFSEQEYPCGERGEVPVGSDHVADFGRAASL